jgi:hypothetical protein
MLRVELGKVLVLALVEMKIRLLKTNSKELKSAAKNERDR